MSRIGKKPVTVPENVTVSVDNGTLKVKGPKGELTLNWNPAMTVEFNADSRQIVVGRPNDLRQNRALHGLTRALINNMVTGVQTPFEKKLEIIGVGYQATMAGKTLSLQVGFANIIKLPIPAGLTVTLTTPTLIVVQGIDRAVVGQFAANVRRVRPPEPYKGKGIRYSGEQVRRKAGKAFGS
ncbi:MAG: 50S ribosomal protein L6 [Planctomycetota bacterium]|nr:MAG: 50S ribosomal protein L6 [Planctomycetota bacterium]